MIPEHSSNPALPAARGGSREALGEVLAACRQYLLWVARRHLDRDLQPKAGASDLVQETLLEAHRDFSQFRGESDAELLAWLRRLLRNNIANFVRHHKSAKRGAGREVPLADTGDVAAAGPRPEAPVEQADELAAFARLSERLPPDSRRVITLWFEGRSFAEIGVESGRSPNAVRMVWMRAVEKLKWLAGAETDSLTAASGAVVPVGSGPVR
jgi:RNA polymerase sigma-70 factor (ECF subfamily)